MCKNLPGLLGLLLLLLAAPAALPAQEPGGDDALERLLEKASEDQKPSQPDAPKPDLAPTDEGLDSLLKKLGESTDMPETTGAAPGGQPIAPPTPPGGAGDPSAEPPLTGEDRTLDDHLRELLGRKKNDQKEPPPDDPGSPLAGAIKKMEEARKRLAGRDTGEQTRKTQEEVVRELDSILEQIRKSQGQGAPQGTQIAQRTREANKPGQQPGSQPSQQPGTTGQGTGPQQVQKPTVNDVLAEQKDTWGDLPPHLRQEMENVFREEMLPAKRDMIIRYYSAVAKKGRPRGGE